MKWNKKKIISFLTVFLLIFSYFSLVFSSIDIYAASKYSSPKSSSFKFRSSSSSKSGSFLKPSSTKTDSGIFSTKPSNDKSNSSNSAKPNTSTTKPDSGNFSTTKPNNSNNSNSEGSSGNDYGGTSSKPIFNIGGYYGGYFNPFNRVMYGFSMSSWILKLVAIITIIVVIYIIIDYIKSKRD